jgi:hypothetical protein
MNSSWDQSLATMENSTNTIFSLPIEMGYKAWKAWRNKKRQTSAMVLQEATITVDPEFIQKMQKEIVVEEMVTRRHRKFDL